MIPELMIVIDEKIENELFRFIKYQIPNEKQQQLMNVLNELLLEFESNLDLQLSDKDDEISDLEDEVEGLEKRLEKTIELDILDKTYIENIEKKISKYSEMKDELKFIKRLKGEKNEN